MYSLLIFVSALHEHMIVFFRKAPADNMKAFFQGAHIVLMIILSSLMTHMHTGRQRFSVANIDFLSLPKRNRKIADKCYFEILESKSGHFGFSIFNPYFT